MIIVCAGHHSGAQGASHNGVTEWELTKEYTKIASGLIAEAGYACMTILNSELGEKIRSINSVKSAKLAIDIHLNSSASGGKGSETLHAPTALTSRSFAVIMQKHIAKVSVPDRGVKLGYYQQDMVARKPLAFLAQTNCPALIIEPFFIQQVEAQRHESMFAVGRAIVDAIKELKL